VITFETEVGIERPIDEVFVYLSDPLNFPRWNSAVQAVRETSTGAYSMERELPSGHAVNDLEIVAYEAPSKFAVQTRSGPTPFRYHYRLSARSGGTVVRLTAEVEPGGAGALLPQLARRAVKRGVDANLATLKELLEMRPQPVD
jgi:uncharacterized protein YndB with AHSA1/START domain